MSVRTREYDAAIQKELDALKRGPSFVNIWPTPTVHDHWMAKDRNGNFFHTKKSTSRREWLTRLPMDKADAHRLAIHARRYTEGGTWKTRAGNVGTWCGAFVTTHDGVLTVGVVGCSACRWRVRMMIGPTAIHLAWRKFEAKEDRRLDRETKKRNRDEAKEDRRLNREGTN